MLGSGLTARDRAVQGRKEGMAHDADGEAVDSVRALFFDVEVAGPLLQFS